jgi:hypothetical protein
MDLELGLPYTHVVYPYLLFTVAENPSATSAAPKISQAHENLADHKHFRAIHSQVFHTPLVSASIFLAPVFWTNRPHIYQDEILSVFI